MLYLPKPRCNKSLSVPASPCFPYLLFIHSPYSHDSKCLFCSLDDTVPTPSTPRSGGHQAQASKSFKTYGTFYGPRVQKGQNLGIRSYKAYRFFEDLRDWVLLRRRWYHCVIPFHICVFLLAVVGITTSAPSYGIVWTFTYVTLPPNLVVGGCRYMHAAAAWSLRKCVPAR